MEKSIPIECADVETSSEDYAARFSGKAGAWLLEQQNEIFIDLIKRVPNETVLDVAGGHGQIAKLLVPLNHQVTVLASAPNCDRQIRPMLNQANCKFETGNLENLKFDGKSFDVVSCFRYLPHTEKWRDLVAELCRVARYAVVVDYPVLYSLNILTPLFFPLKKQLEGNTREYALFTHSQINSEFEKNGFKLSGVKAEFFFPMVMHRVLRNRKLSQALEFLPQILGLKKLFGSPVIACYVPK